MRRLTRTGFWKSNGQGKSFMPARAGVILSACLCFGLVAFLSGKAAGEKEILVGYAPNPFIPQTSIISKGASDVRELFEKGSSEFKKLYGYTVSLKIFPAPKFLYKAFQDRAIDFAPTYLPMYLTAKNMGLPIKPFASYTTSGKKGGAYCIYIHKDSVLKDVKQLQGKSFAAELPIFSSKKDSLPPKESYLDWIGVKKILMKHGINKPLGEVFKDFKVLPVPPESVAYSVLLKKFDAFYTSESYFYAITEYDKGFSNLKPLSCLQVPVMDPAVYRKDVDPDMVAKVKNYLISPPKVSKAEKVKEEFNILKVYPVEEKDYQIYFQWLNEAKQKGWFDEFNTIMKNAPRPGKTKSK